MLKYLTEVVDVLASVLVTLTLLTALIGVILIAVSLAEIAAETGG